MIVSTRTAVIVATGFLFLGVGMTSITFNSLFREYLKTTIDAQRIATEAIDTSKKNIYNFNLMKDSKVRMSKMLNKCLVQNAKLREPKNDSRNRK